MRMENNDPLVKGNEKKKKGKGMMGGAFLAAGILVLLVAVFAAGNQDLPEGSDLEKQIGDGSQKELGETGLDDDEFDLIVNKPVPVVDSKDPEEEGADEGGSQPQGELPVEQGTVLKPYSQDALVYSETLQQYVTHEGIDLAADPGTAVRAMAAGTVTQVYEDDRLGMTVVVSHSDGYKTSYSNLSRENTAEEGDEVTAGQVIGKVGSTALFESQDPSHLHFAVYKDDVAVDPAEILKTN